ncbi:MAG: hypothetical protein ACREAB_12130 [Blastocatellia bacterium]
MNFALIVVAAAFEASRVDQPYMANGFERGARLLTGSLDTISEFRVQTSNYNAEYGRASGSYINVATKSGGNQIHFTLFEFFRNTSFRPNWSTNS